MGFLLRKNLKSHSVLEQIFITSISLYTQHSIRFPLTFPRGHAQPFGSGHRSGCRYAFIRSRDQPGLPTVAKGQEKKECAGPPSLASYGGQPFAKVGRLGEAWRGLGNRARFPESLHKRITLNNYQTTLASKLGINICNNSQITNRIIFKLPRRNITYHSHIFFLKNIGGWYSRHWQKFSH